MTKSEFIKSCQLSGYATKKQAEQYAAGKTDFTDDDLMEVFRIAQNLSEREQSAKEKFRLMNGHRTTKRYKYDQY